MADAGTPDYQIVRMQPQHCRAVARLHVLGYAGFLASLGAPALSQFYRTYLDYRQGCGLVVRTRPRGEVVGFVAGTEDLRLHYRTFLLRRLAPMLPALAARAVTRPSLALGLLRRAWQLTGVVGRRPRPHGAGSIPLPPAHLMMMVVHPRHRGRGVGEALVRGFTVEMARRRVPRLVLGVRDDNYAARRLYERLGWQPTVMERALDGSVSWLYLRDTDLAP